MDPVSGGPPAGKKNMTDRTKELGTRPIGALLMQYAVPAIIAMTASSLYNMVDSVFIGQGVGPMAIAGLAITFPLMNLSAAFGAMVGVGTATMISVRLGQKNREEAQHFFGNSLTLNVLMGLLFMGGVLAFLDPILRFFGASDQTLPYAREYMEWILYGNVFTHLYFGLNAVLRSAGHPRTAMYATILTVLLNTALDPLFIYGLHLGIRGAAIATVLSQCVSLCWQLWIFSRPSEVVFFRRDTWQLRSRIVGGILYYVIMGVALWLRLPTNDLKLFTAAIVALALALPHLRQKGYGSARRSEKKEAGSHG